MTSKTCLHEQKFRDEKKKNSLGQEAGVQEWVNILRVWPDDIAPMPWFLCTKLVCIIGRIKKALLAKRFVAQPTLFSIFNGDIKG